MKRIFLRLKQPLRNERGEITFFACFFVVGIVMLISFLLLYASIRITCINIRNGAKMELNNLSGTIYASCREALGKIPHCLLVNSRQITVRARHCLRTVVTTHFSLCCLFHS